MRLAVSMLGQLAGQWVDSFQLVRMLGSGALGAVYLARDSVLCRDVAIKLLAKGDEDDDDEDRKNRFLREARAAARLVHPHVVQIYQIGEIDELRFIAMEYVEGTSLRHAAKRMGGRLPEQAVIEWMRQAADALRLAASLGICHRDIKPQNLLLTSSDALKIADFGLATQFGGGQTIGPGASTELEGTPYYMSPEQCSSSTITPASDVYNLGCTFYHLLVGAPPFAFSDFIAAIRAHCAAPVPEARSSVPGVDPLLNDLLKRCMAKDPSSRPTPEEIFDLLDDMRVLRRSQARSPGGPGSETAALPPPPSETLASSTRTRPKDDTPDTARSASGAVPPSHARPSFSSPPAPPDPPSGSRATPDSPSATAGDYCAFFGLRSYPFSDIRVPASYWDGGPYADALGRVAAQVGERHRIMFLLGQAGSGKTFTCEMLEHKLPRVRVLTVEPQLIFGAKIFFMLARQLGVTVNASASTRLMVEAVVARALPADDPHALAMVVVDSVDPHDRALLADLASIATTAPLARFTVVLVGPESLPEDLRRNGAAPSLVSGASPVVLRPMTQQEMVGYLDFRMRAAGGALGLRLDDAGRQLLHARSGGNPRLVNVFCHNALTLAALEGEQAPSFDTLRLGMRSKTYLTPEAARALASSPH